MLWDVLNLSYRWRQIGLGAVGVIALILFTGVSATRPTSPSASPLLCAAPTPEQNPLASLFSLFPAPASLAQGSSTKIFSWADRATSPIARFEALGIAAYGKIYVFGGYNSQLQATARADAYVPETDSWQPLSPMPEALTHTPVVLEENIIWFIGGFLGDHPGPSIDRVWKYNITLDTWSAGPSLPAPRGAGAAAIGGRKLHFFGGTDRQNNQYNDVTSHYVLDLDNQGAGWQLLAELPEARNHLGGIALNGKIYAIGGQSQENESDTNTTRVDVYDPASNLWIQAADMPRGLGHITASVVAVNGRILVIGGSINGGGGGRSSDYALLYDPQLNLWVQLPSLPSGRKTPIADMIGREIYVTTGAGGTMDQTWVGTLAEHWESAKALPVGLAEVSGGIIGNQLYLVGGGNPATLAYDLSDNSWSSAVALAERPYLGDHHAAEVFNNELYLFSGLGGAAGKVQIYDPATNSWSEGEDMPFAAGSSSSALIDGTIYIAGGIVSSTTTSQLARYNPQSDSWAELAPMPYGRNHAAAATDGQKLYLFGGRGPGSGETNTLANGFDTVQIYDPATNSWATSLDPGSLVPPMPQARGGMGRAVFVLGELYIMGGETQDGAGATADGVYDRVDIYNPITRSWRAGTSMLTARHGIFPLAVADRIYVASGGVQAGSSQSTVLEIYNTAPDERAIPSQNMRFYVPLISGNILSPLTS